MSVCHNHIQGDSGGICNTFGNDGMCDSKQKSLYEHRSDFELDFCLESHILSFPKVFQIPPETPCIYIMINYIWLHVSTPASCTMGTGSFLGVKRPGRCTDHPPPSSAEVKKE
jgi:hypothetical protein